jgi:hypothetical protein
MIVLLLLALGRNVDGMHCYGMCKTMTVGSDVPCTR